MRPRVAVIGTGGTISSFGDGPFDLQDYVRHGRRGDAAEMIAHFAPVSELAELVPVPFPPVPSTDLGFCAWRTLVETIDRLVAEGAVDGIVILHGTATMEESAYALSLTAPTDLPIVLTGAQRPASGLSTDGPANLAAAVRTALSPQARGMGVLLVMNEEIHAAREVTKTSTWRLQTFRTPDFGLLGHADADRVAFYRRPMRGHERAPFDIRGTGTPPRVDIVYAHQDADGVAVEAFVAAGAKGLVVAALAPGFVPPALAEALRDAADAGIVCAVSTRAGSGRVVPISRITALGLVAADNLNPQKARILLLLGLLSGRGAQDIAALFETH